MARLGVRNRPPVGSAPTVRDCDDFGVVSDIDHPGNLQAPPGRRTCRSPSPPVMAKAGVSVPTRQSSPGKR